MVEPRAEVQAPGLDTTASEFSAAEYNDGERNARAEPRPGRPAPIIDNRIASVAAPNAFDAFTEEQVAAMLGVEPKTVRNLTKRSRRLAFVPVGKRRLILRKDLERFLDKRRVPSVDEISSPAGKERSQ